MDLIGFSLIPVPMQSENRETPHQRGWFQWLTLSKSPVSGVTLGQGVCMITMIMIRLPAKAMAMGQTIFIYWQYKAIARGTPPNEAAPG